jgi:hypothetical protein
MHVVWEMTGDGLTDQRSSGRSTGEGQSHLQRHDM